jgi:hypothetical protein
MFPVFSVWRSGNISAQAVETYFGPLKVGLKVQKFSKYVLFLLSGLFVMVAAGVYLCYRL